MVPVRPSRSVRRQSPSMSRGLRLLASMGALPLFALFGVGSVASCSSSTPAAPSTDAGSGALHGTATAGSGVLAATKVTHYTYSIAASGVTQVTLLDATSASLGMVTFSRNAGSDSVATYTGTDGSTATITTLAFALGDKSTLYRRIYAADGEQLEANVVSTTQSGGGSYELASPQGTQPAGGAYLAPTPGFGDVLLVKQGAVTASTTQVKAWESASTPHLLGSPAVATLDPVTWDSNLFKAMYKTVEAGVGSGAAPASYAGTGLGQTRQADSPADCAAGFAVEEDGASACLACGPAAVAVGGEALELGPLLLVQLTELAGTASDCEACAEALLGPANAFLACAYPQQSASECDSDCAASCTSQGLPPGKCSGNNMSSFLGAPPTITGGGCMCGVCDPASCQKQAADECGMRGVASVHCNGNLGSSPGCAIACNNVDAGPDSGNSATSSGASGTSTSSTGSNGSGNSGGTSTSSSHTSHSSSSHTMDAGRDGGRDAGRDGGHDAGHDATLQDGGDAADSGVMPCMVTFSGAASGSYACTALASYSPSDGVLFTLQTVEGTTVGGGGFIPYLEFGATLASSDNFHPGKTYTNPANGTALHSDGPAVWDFSGMQGGRRRDPHRAFPRQRPQRRRGGW